MQLIVVPLVGTWIETIETGLNISSIVVVPLVGTWIETYLNRSIFSGIPRRPPRGDVD